MRCWAATWNGMATRSAPARRVTATLTIIVVLMIGCPATKAQAQMSAAVTVDNTPACKKDQDFTQYATLLLSDVSAAMAFRMDHDCSVLKPGTFVSVDQGSTQRKSNHVCIRPVGSYDCSWTFAGHIKNRYAFCNKDDDQPSSRKRPCSPRKPLNGRLESAPTPNTSRLATFAILC